MIKILVILLSERNLSFIYVLKSVIFINSIILSKYFLLKYKWIINLVVPIILITKSFL